MPNPLSLKAGHMVGPGRFTLIRELGRGGMGVVWLAHDTRLNERVALKFLPPEVAADPAALNDLRRETVRSHRLNHPHILRLHDFHQQPDGVAFISMEYVDGPTLTIWRLEQSRQVLAWEQLAPPLQQLCSALDYAHGEGVIHRDLKPANVMLDNRGRVKLADFGIAAVVSDSMSRVSAKPSTGGTLAYMSPQQLAGRPPSVTDDLYALGATLYELLTGKPPFYSGDLTHQILNVPAQPVDERLLDLGVDNPVPPEVAAMVMACLAKDPEKRPPHAKAVAAWAGLVEAPRTAEERFAAQVGGRPRAEVAEGPGSPVMTTPDSLGPRAQWQWLAVAAAAVLIVGFVGWVLLHMTSGLAHGGTYVSGTIAGQTWTSKGSPYLVTGDVSVAQLDIRPGVEALSHQCGLRGGRRPAGSRDGGSANPVLDAELGDGLEGHFLQQESARLFHDLLQRGRIHQQRHPDQQLHAKLDPLRHREQHQPVVRRRCQCECGHGDADLGSLHDHE
jgi:hypothetical protein